MDTEEIHEIAFHRQNGRPETTKGPYYHKTWWESYKGAVKGIIGGILAGGVVGAAVGGVVLTGLALATVPFGGVTGGIAILASTTLFGMYEGKEKFEKVGITTGAIAAANETSEVRMKEYVREKFTDLTNEIRELKAAMAGKKDVASLTTDVAAPDTAPIFDESDYRSTHMSANSPKDKDKFIFWNVAGIGAVVGAGVAAVATLALGENLGHLASELIGHGAVANLGATGVGGLFVSASAALGASFGINREVFRKIFDVTDCWFMGIANGPCSVEDIAKAQGVEPPQLPPHTPPASIKAMHAQPEQTVPSTTISDSSIAQQQSTMFRDKILAEQAKRALLSMDHTTAVRH